ncbi:RIP metalloprotease RseP [Vulcanibacillus modesticaldus]|uniref:RIP metalloprotease RseP n=1 Tax=Vulcanibacillus modesticaldus TaxID=337097 RepID=UPI00159F1DDB|nr:RIP metalloprotease RseP [Vulcanibacillus modesticaldus]
MNLILISEIVLAFVAIMFVHELGHFIFAKKAGILVREFSLGLGPKLFTIKKGETYYSLRILPFGAYVKMAGEDPEINDFNPGQKVGVKTNSKGEVTDIYIDTTMEKEIKVDQIDLERELYIKGIDEKENIVTYPISSEAFLHHDGKKTQIAPWDRQFGSKSIIDRFMTIIAGPLFNILFTLIVIFSIAMMVGVPTDQIMITNIVEDSPAELAGLQEGDIILGVNDIIFDSSEDIVKMIQKSPGVEINLLIERDGKQLVKQITPKADENGIGKIGVGLSPVQKKATIIEAASSAVKQTTGLAVVTIESFRMLFTGNVGIDDIAGPVGIIEVTSAYAKKGLLTLMNWTAVLSLYIGIFNLIPIPALDGSRLLFLSIEALRGKPIDPQKESMVHLIGFAFLMLIMILVTINDVSKLFS